ncbi:hypothetical protein, partial [Lacticaseibacillus paracasei]|uniref:hypothetical protein n=1 Tax=Lacticaseibacillus paracasei TaxID=1597 RepID=UPI00247825AA
MSKNATKSACHSWNLNERQALFVANPFLIISPVNDYEHEKFFYFSHLDFRAEAAEARAHCDTWSPYADKNFFLHNTFD